jgi:hypothetical protein
VKATLRSASQAILADAHLGTRFIWFMEIKDMHNFPRGYWGRMDLTNVESIEKDCWPVVIPLAFVERPGKLSA